MDAKVRGERQADPQPTLERAEVASSGGGQPEIKHAATDKGEVKSDIAKPAMIRESEAHAPVGEVESIATEQFATGESEVKSEIAKLIVVHESEEGAHRDEVESIAMKQLTGECQALVHIVEAESQVAEQTTIAGSQLLFPRKDATSDVAEEHLHVDEVESESIKPLMTATFPGTVLQLAIDETEEPTQIGTVESVVIEHPTSDKGVELVDVADGVMRQQRSDESESCSCVGETKFEVAETSAVSSTEGAHCAPVESAVSTPDRHPSDASERVIDAFQEAPSSTSGDSAEESRATISL